MDTTNKRKPRKRVLLHCRSIVKKLAIDLTIDPFSENYVLSRLEAEGISFLTKTLPRFSKFALTCCDRGFISRDRSELTSFAWKRSSPAFLAGLLEKAISGCASALFRIRQFCDYFYKTVFSFTKNELADAAEKYICTDDEYEFSKIDWKMVEMGRKALFRLFPRLCSVTPDEVFGKSSTRDGPGAFASSGFIAKSHNVTFEEFKKLSTGTIGSHPRELDAYSGCFRAYPSSKEILLSQPDRKIADLVFVPKDSRGPRTISKEPYFLLKAQMAFADYMCRDLTMESKGRINFQDQTVNQHLSEQASVDGEKATLDLEKASDRLWLEVLRRMTLHVPFFRFIIRRMRSTHVRMPDKTVRRLKKFANMGSGLCFPTLSLVVFVASVLGVQATFHTSLELAAEMVYVYGDDVIVPKEAVLRVAESLKSFGLIVNNDKSFWQGNFRESCGADFYHGKSVAPVRLRLAGCEFDTVKEYRNGVLPVVSDSGILQLERHARELVQSGLIATSDYYYDNLENKLGPLPYVHMDSKGLGRVSLCENPKSVEQKLYVPFPVKKVTADACGYKGLGRAFKSQQGLGEDFCLTPLRRKLKLKRVVLGPAEICMYGDPIEPTKIFAGLGVVNSNYPYFNGISSVG